MKLAFAISAQPTAFAAIGGGDLDLRVRQLGRLHYQGIELAIRDPSGTDVKRLQRLLGPGLRLAAIGTGQAYVDEGLSLSDLDAEVRGHALARMKQHADLAAEFGALVIVGLIRGRVTSVERRDAHLSHLEHALGAFADHAARRGVTIVIEPINRYETNIMNTADETMEIIGEIGRPNVKLLLDTFHMNIEEADIIKTVERHGKDTAHVHIADSNRRYPGMGHIDFPSVVAALTRVGYRGYLSGEMLPYPNVETAVERFATRMREVMHGQVPHED